MVAVILATAIALFFFFLHLTTSPTAKVIAADAVKEFNIDAFRFGYNPDTITVNKGDKVKITINNVDVPHGIIIPGLNAQGVNSVEFTADKTGEFVWHCLIPCGQGHMQMTGRLIVK